MQNVIGLKSWCKLRGHDVVVSIRISGCWKIFEHDRDYPNVLNDITADFQDLSLDQLNREIEATGTRHELIRAPQFSEPAPGVQAVLAFPKVANSA